MGVASFEAIGGKARDAIMADLSLASGVPTGTIVPTERLGYVYMTYRVSIPLGTFTRHYWYSIEDKNWMQFDTPGLLQTGRCEEVWTGVLANPPIGTQPPGTGATGGGGTPTPPPKPPFGCFTGNVRIKTPEGWKRFDSLPTNEMFKIVNETGEHVAVLVIHKNYSDTMIDMGDETLVTIGHLMKYEGGWRRAKDHFSGRPVLEHWRGAVYNIQVMSAHREDFHFILENGEVAHNSKAPDAP